MTSSELAELRALCDRVAIIYHGRVAAILPPDRAPDACPGSRWPARPTPRERPPRAAAGFVREMGVPRLLIAGFVLALFATAVATKMDIGSLVTDSIVRVARNGVLVLALLPAIQGGIGLNFGLPLGIICGLVGCVFTLNAAIGGVPGLLVATGIGRPRHSSGRRVRLAPESHARPGDDGRHHLGFAVVSGMSIFWLLAPFTNPTLIWAIGGKGSARPWRCPPPPRRCWIAGCSSRSRA